MRPSRWQSFNPVWNQLQQLQEEMNHLFDRWGGKGRRWLGLGGYPAVNVWEDGDAVLVEAELPGLDLKGLQMCRAVVLQSATVPWSAFLMHHRLLVRIAALEHLRLEREPGGLKGADEVARLLADSPLLRLGSLLQAPWQYFRGPSVRDCGIGQGMLNALRQRFHHVYS
jgi:hypothetical protein